MEDGVIPLRHGSLPGVIRLPKRYVDCSKPEMSPSWKRKSSTVPVQKGTINERLDDLMQAMLWVKQELIHLRQHDLLLKRQFTDIHDTIVTLQRSGKYRHVLTSSNSSLQSSGSVDFYLDNYSVRSALSATALDGTDTDTDEEFRPRVSSMKTTRDLAALARRRGSKELI